MRFVQRSPSIVALVKPHSEFLFHLIQFFIISQSAMMRIVVYVSSLMAICVEFVREGPRPSLSVVGGLP